MDDVEQAHAAAVSELVASPGRVLVVGGVDSGKTTFCLRVARAALEAGLTPAVVDADLGQSTVGPPTTVGLKVFRDPSDFEPERMSAADALHFVGSISPRGHFLPLVVGTAKLVMRAIEMRARPILVDTSGLIGGVAGQVLKLTKAELCRPHQVVALARGGELEPIVGVLRRFLGLGVISLPVHPEVGVRSVEERAAYRERRLAEHFKAELHRYRVKPTVFLPAPPPGFDPSFFDGLLVGVDDGAGGCLGLGILEAAEGPVRLITPVAQGVKGLRLGSVRATVDGRITERVDIRSLLGTD